MVDQKDESFKNMSLKEKTVTVIGIIFFIVLVIGFVFGVFFFGFAGIFELLGVHYESIWSLIIFVLSFFILGLMVDLFIDAMVTLTVENITGYVSAFFIQFLFGFASNWLVLLIVDAFIKGITLSLETKLIVALLLGVLDPVFDNKKVDR